MLTLSGIQKSYGDRVLFADAALQVNRLDRIGLVGPNGAGKTTLFSIILGQESADAGGGDTASGDECQDKGFGGHDRLGPLVSKGRTYAVNRAFGRCGGECSPQGTAARHPSATVRAGGISPTPMERCPAPASRLQECTA